MEEQNLQHLPEKRNIYFLIVVEHFPQTNLLWCQIPAGRDDPFPFFNLSIFIRVCHRIRSCKYDNNIKILTTMYLTCSELASSLLYT